MALCDNRSFIAERSMNLESFTPLGVRKIVSGHKLDSTVTNVGGYVPKIVHEFYANLLKFIDTQGSWAIEAMTMTFLLRLFVIYCIFLCMILITLLRSMTWIMWPLNYLELILNGPRLMYSRFLK